MDEYEVKNIICDMLRPSSYVDFTTEIKELRNDSLSGPANLKALVSCYKFRFGMDGCNVLESLGELR